MLMLNVNANASSILVENPGKAYVYVRYSMISSYNYIFFDQTGRKKKKLSNLITADQKLVCHNTWESFDSISSVIDL